MRRRLSRVLLIGLAMSVVVAGCGNDAPDDASVVEPPESGPDLTGDPAEPPDAAGDDPAEPPPLPVASVLDLLEGLDRLDGGSYEIAVPDGQAAVAWFWAPWCPNCRAIAPTVADLAAQYEDDLVLVGVAGQGGVDEMHRFVADTGTGDIVHVIDDDGSIWAEFGVTTQPVFAIVQPDGTVEMMIRPSRDVLADRFALLASP